MELSRWRSRPGRARKAPHSVGCSSYGLGWRPDIVKCAGIGEVGGGLADLANALVCKTSASRSYMIMVLIGLATANHESAGRRPIHPATRVLWFAVHNDETIIM